MTDAVTNNYDLTLPTVGGDSGTWGGILNSNVFTPIDSILGSNLAVTMTSADVSLTVSQFQNAIFVITGALTGNHKLIVPLSPNSATVACGGKFTVANNTTGAFTVTVITAATASTGVTVPQGFAASLYSDGTNVWYNQNGLPAYALASNGNPNTTLAGTAGSVNTNANLAVDYTAGQLYLCTTTGNSATAVWATVGGTTFNMPSNLTLNASVSTNVLTVSAFAANTGVAPTATNPINIAFRDSTRANGDPVIVSATSSLAVSAPVGATLGAVSGGNAFRFWIVVLNNGGVPVLALINCNSGSGIAPLDETTLISATAISSGSKSRATFYGSTTVTNRAFRILGFLTYESGLVTAGTYNNPPTVVQLFGPGVKKPGDVLQTNFQFGGTTFTVNTSSAANFTNASVTFYMALTSSVTGAAAIQPGLYWSGSNSSFTEYGNAAVVANQQYVIPMALNGLSRTATSSSNSWTLGIFSNTNFGGASFNGAAWLVNEIMG